MTKGELDHLVRAGFLKKGDAAYKSAEQALKTAETEKNPVKKEGILRQVKTAQILGARMSRGK